VLTFVAATIAFAPSAKKLVLKYTVQVNETSWNGATDCAVSSGDTPFFPNGTAFYLIVGGGCDAGDFTWWVQGQNNTSFQIHTEFRSSVIEDASPPTCDYTIDVSAPLPQENSVCETWDSREGYHMTGYVFNITGYKYY